MKHYLRAFILLTLFLTLLVPVDSSEQLKMRDLSPEFLKFQQQLRSFQLGERLYGPDSSSGALPSPVGPLYRQKAQVRSLHPLAGLPARYDLRQLNRVTGIKNQMQCGSCWSFATMASIESSLMPGEEKALSPEHLILNHGFDYDPCEGGHSWMSQAYLSRWGGPINESDMPYREGSSQYEGYSELIEKHIQEIIFLPERNSFTDNGDIKQLITEKGAVTVVYYADSSYLNTSSAAYYCDDEKQINHAVAIVGWDDNYPASSFKQTPPGNGAFIVKNSWGTSWGDRGYFYLSYYDKTARTFVSFHQSHPISDFGTNYYHDPLGWCTSYGYKSTQAWGANVFEAVNNSPISAVSLITSDVNTQCLIRVYINATRENPTAGLLVSQQTVTKTYPGYYTIRLNQAVPVSRGQLFSVVVFFQNGGDDLYPVAVETPFDGYSSQATSRAGESFISADGQNWHDFATKNANVCIKAFGSHVNLDMTVSVQKQQVRTWLISRFVAVISVGIGNADATELNKIIIFRKTSANSPYEVWRELPAAELIDGRYFGTDAYLDENKTYFYKLVAVDDNGSVLANSGEFTLENN